MRAGMRCSECNAEYGIPDTGARSKHLGEDTAGAIAEDKPQGGSDSKAASKVPAAGNTLRILKLLASRRDRSRRHKFPRPWGCPAPVSITRSA